MPELMSVRGALIALAVGALIFAGSYGVGMAGGAEPSSAPAAAPRQAAELPEIEQLGEAKPAPGMARKSRPKPKPAPAPEPELAEEEPEPTPEPEPVQQVRPAPRPTPAPQPSPAPTPSPSPGGGFDDSG